MFMQLFVNSMIAGCVYALNAFGFTMIYGTMRFFNMAYGASFMVSAYFFYVFKTYLNFPFYIALGISAVCICFVMIIIDHFTFFRLRHIKAPSWATMMVSIGMAIVIEAIISTIFGNDIKIIRTGLQTSYSLAGAAITPNQIRIIYVSILLMCVLWIFLKKTRTGKAIRAVANDSEMATVIGIDTEKIFRIVMIIGYSVACVASVLIAFDYDIEPLMGQNIQLKAIVASVIGGVGNIQGALLGGLILGFAENFGIWKISAGWKDGIALALLIIFILWKPSLFGIEE